MRQLLMICILCTPFLAEAYSCPKYMTSNKKAQKIHEWLVKFSDQTELHSCKLEIVTCDPEGEALDDTPIGELLVTTPDGREAYISMDFPAEDDKRFKTKVKTFKRGFYYKKIDRYYEPTEGRTEVWQVELATKWDTITELNYFELGIYTTNSKLGQENGNDSHWYNCREQ